MAMTALNGLDEDADEVVGGGGAAAGSSKVDAPIRSEAVAEACT